MLFYGKFATGEDSTWWNTVGKGIFAEDAWYENCISRSVPLVSSESKYREPAWNRLSIFLQVQLRVTETKIKGGIV